jgi:hypothetical protein
MLMPLRRVLFSCFSTLLLREHALIIMLDEA